MYDQRFRPVRTSSTNYLEGYTQVDSKMDWAGKVLETHTFHKYDANATELEVVDYFEYTDQDRVTIHTQEIIGFHDKELIANNTYDELGQLIKKEVGGSETSSYQKIDYKYNIRGWLKEINNVDDLNTDNDLFAFKINYNEVTESDNGDINVVQSTFGNTVKPPRLRKEFRKNILRKAPQTSPATQSVQNKYPMKSSANVSRLCGIFLTFIAIQYITT